MTEAFTITSDMLAPITSQVNAAITSAAPVGIGVMAVLIGITVLKKVIKKFTN